MGDMTDLVAWLRQQIDEDEIAWEMVAARDVVELLHGEPLAPRMLAEVAAKRAILELHDGEHDCRELITGVYPHDWPSAAPWGSAGEAWRHASSEHFEGPCPTLRLFAQPFAGRPGWREEWRT
jgi:hypothetical protein